MLDARTYKRCYVTIWSLSSIQLLRIADSAVQVQYSLFYLW